MKATGIVRKVDELGRVVIPIELRNKLGIKEKDPIEIYVDGSSVILKKYQPNCVFCGGTKNLVEYKDKLVCEKCGKEFVGNCRTKRSICDKCWIEFEKNRIRIAVRKTRM